MGYNIYIGNAVVESDDEELYTRYVVERATHPAAPRWPDHLGPDGKPDFMRGIDISEDSNGRHPSYTSLANWAREVGLYELFLGPDGRDGLLNPHPGCQRLTPGILAELSAARLKWEERHPGAKPGWRDGEDPTLAKLIWYEWWTKWALENCKLPAIQNS